MYKSSPPSSKMPIAADSNYLKAVIDCLGAGVCLLDGAGCVLSINPEGERLLGWPKTELAGQTFFELIELPTPPGSYCQFQLSDGISTQLCRNENGHFRRKDNSIVPVSYVVNPIVEDGTPIGAVLVFFDITEHKRAQKALSKSEAKNRALLNAIPDLMFRLAIDGTFLDFKAAKGANLSVLLEREFVGKKVQEVMPSSVAEACLLHLEQALATDEVQIFEYQLFLNSHRCDYEARIVVSGEDEVLAIVRDISDRKRAEEALSQSEEKYRSVVDNIKEVIFQTDAAGFFTFLNPAWTEITGFAQAESIGTHFLTYFHPDDRQSHQEVFQELIERHEESCRSVVRYLTKDGSVRWMEVNARLMLDKNGHFYGTFGTLNDTTQRKLAEDLLEYRIKFDRLITALSTNFINLAPDEIDTGINEALQAIGEFTSVDRSYIFQISDDGTYLKNTHEWCAAEIESHQNLFQKVPIESLPKLMEKLDRCENIQIPNVQDLPPEALAELQCWRSPPIQSTMVFPMVCGRSLRGLVGFDSVRETELLRKRNEAFGVRKSPEGELKKIWTDESVSLLKMVAEMLANALERQRTEAELQRAAHAAEAANRAKSQFLAGMSHELRTPLNAIIGYSEMLQEEAEDLGYKEVKPDLEKIRAAGNHLLSVINDILDISKIEAGRMNLYIEKFDLLSLVDNVVATIQPLVDKNGNTLEVDCDTEIGEAIADLTKVRQILFNLLSNAAKFTEGGLIKLTVEKREGKKEKENGKRETGKGKKEKGEDKISLNSSVLASPTSHFMIFTVTDTGIGIPPDQLENIFQPFTQADASTTRQYGGTGLGLAISQRFCQMMGGEITVCSKVGVGSTFTVYLPSQQVSDREPKQ